MGEAALNDPRDTNGHVRKFIQYYGQLKAPGYAVLVVGSWGVGKTYLLRELLPWDGENATSVYVSLFGLKSAEEVMGALYAKMDPKGSAIKQTLSGLGEAVKGISVAGFGIGGAGTALTSMLSNMVNMNLDSDRIVIFDDLERSRISIKTIMGLLNQLVEHLGFRVIVVAHDEKLASEFVFSKEKLFGQTLNVYPQLEKALAAFVGDIADESDRLEVSEYSDAIKVTFQSGGFQSLRLLKHGIQDVVRLVKCVEERFKSNKVAMVELITIFLAFDLELRSGNINKYHIIEQRQKLLAAAMSRVGGKPVDVDAEKIQVMHQKYKNVNLESGLISEKFLHDALVNGEFYAEELSMSLEGSPYYVSSRDLPDWRKVMSFDSLSDSETNTAVMSMERSFKERSIDDFGAMMHTFALRLLLSHKKEIRKTVKTVERECIKYIDAMAERGVLAREGAEEWLESPFRAQSASGFTFWVDEGVRGAFDRISEYFIAAVKESAERKYPEIAKALIVKLAESPEEFASSISYIGGGKHKFAEVPVLKAISPSKFAKHLIDSPRHDNSWHMIRTALERRYSAGALNGKLAAERRWITEVIAALRKEAQSAAGLVKFRIERLIPRIEV